MTEEEIKLITVLSVILPAFIIAKLLEGGIMAVVEELVILTIAMVILVPLIWWIEI